MRFLLFADLTFPKTKLSAGSLRSRPNISRNLLANSSGLRSGTFLERFLVFLFVSVAFGFFGDGDGIKDIDLDRLCGEIAWSSASTCFLLLEEAYNHCQQTVLSNHVTVQQLASTFMLSSALTSPPVWGFCGISELSLGPDPSSVLVLPPPWEPASILASFSGSSMSMMTHARFSLRERAA